MLGDFYAQSPVRRGVSLPASLVDSRHPDNQALELQRLKSWPQSSCENAEVPTCNLGSGQGCWHFQVCQGAWDPQELPQDPLFYLEPTTIHLCGTGASQVAGKLCDLLEMRMPAVVQRVNAVSCSIRAEVYAMGTWCLLKVRMYKDKRALAVEFQRRSGDSFAFQYAFQLAKELFDPTCQTVTESKLENFVDRCALQDSTRNPDEPLSGLLKFLDSSDLSCTLRCELASQLVTSVRDYQEKKTVLSENFRSDIVEACVAMLRSTECSLFYPASLILLMLAKPPSSLSSFSVEILQLIAEKLHFKGVGPHVTLRLIETVARFLTQHQAHSSFDETERLYTSLETMVYQAESSHSLELCARLTVALESVKMLC